MKPKAILADFEAFALRGNVVDFVMAVVIGGAIGRIITASVDGLVMPLFTLGTREAQWEQWSVWHFRIGPVLSAGLDFLAKALVMYVVLIKGLAIRVHRKDSAGASEARSCPYCREAIHVEAIRCSHCGSSLVQAKCSVPLVLEAPCSPSIPMFYSPFQPSNPSSSSAIGPQRTSAPSKP